jgi:hypothetical protein
MHTFMFLKRNLNETNVVRSQQGNGSMALDETGEHGTPGMCKIVSLKRTWNLTLGQWETIGRF